MSEEYPVPQARGERGRWLPEAATEQKAADILARYDKGESIYDIAADMQISHQGAYRVLLRYREDQWKDAQAARALTEYETSKSKLEVIWKQENRQRDGVALACAREQIKASQWELERVLRKVYGQDHAQSGVSVQVNIGVVRDRDVP